MRTGVTSFALGKTRDSGEEGMGEKLSRAQELRDKLGPFFGATSAPTIVVDRDGRFVTTNDAAVAQYGYEFDELVGMAIQDLLAMPQPELATDLERAFGGDAAPLPRRPHRRKNGSVLWVVPIAGPVVLDGERVVALILQDVTQLVSAEERARYEHERASLLWQTAVDRFGDSFVLFDAQRRILRINHTATVGLGRTESQLIGRRCDEVFLARCTRQPCPHAVALQERRRVVEELVTHKGRPMRVEVCPAPPNDAGIALIHVGHDLSEERALRTRLLTADRLASLGRVAAGVAHEVNNPAAFVTLALPLTKDRIAHGRTGEALSLIDEAIDAMGQINEVMRDLGGVARDRPRAMVDLANVVSGAIRLASYEAQARARVERVFEDSLSVEARGARLGQVLLNLLLNAAQAIPKGDPDRNRIEVRVRRAGECALVEVADTGPGVDDGIAHRLFEPFFTTRGSLGGTGLGLWLSRAIIEEEGGTLTWRNRPEGGAVFTVSLPLGRPALVQAAMG
jgi:PAS domain S-box-containing protein